MKLYYSPGACSLAPHIALIEAGLAFQAERVDLRAKTLADGSDYTRINPKGSVPALILDSGELLTEVAVILQYIADQAPEKNLAPRPGTMERVRLQEWLNYVATEIHKNFSTLFSADRLIANPEGNAQLKAGIKENLSKRFAFLNAHLEKRDFLMGEAFTVPDTYLFTTLRWTKVFAIDLSSWPALASYVGRIRARESVAQALKAESPRA